MLTSSPPTRAPRTDKTGMDFRRRLPEIRCQSCLSPGSEPTPRSGFSTLFPGSPVCPRARAEAAVAILGIGNDHPTSFLAGRGYDSGDCGHARSAFGEGRNEEHTSEL